MDRRLQNQDLCFGRRLLATIAWSAKGCVITDVAMPEMTGIELMIHIVKRRLSLPVIVITGNANVALAALAMQRGAADFLKKPISAPSLLAAVARALMPGHSHASTAA
ncbi:MAG: response regulator [Alphaproteobacteria bacterium]|nr:response regulator [Alphaproteobacteria bacterium]